MPYNSESAWWLKKIRDTFKEDKAKGLEAAQIFDRMRQDPQSEFYAPHASGKSNYKDLTDYFQVDRFDDDFFRTNAGLTQYMRYGASGTPLAPTKRSRLEEVAAYQYYRAQKADEYTRTLEDQWRSLQKELSDKVAFGMDDDAIVAGIDWTKYGALREYEDNVRIRNTPLLTRPVSYSEESLYGVLSAVRKGGKVGQTDRDYLPELTDYYTERTAQEEKRTAPNANKPGLPGYQAPAMPGTQNAGLVSAAENEPEDKTTEQPAITPEQQKQQERNEFNDLQYKLNQGYDLSPEQRERWMELYPTYSHTAGKSTYRVSASGGASDVSGGKSIRDQNEEWFTKYVGLINSGYTTDYEHRMPSIEQLADYRNMASDMNMTVEQFFTEQYGGKPEWLEKIDYGEKRKTNPELITRLRPLEEVLPDYLAGNELSEAEYEMIWQYDRMHPNLLSGMKQDQNFASLNWDSRMNLGKTAFAALSAADSQEITKEESNALILSIGQDMDAMFGRYDTLEEYYAANPERASELQAFTANAKARDEAKAALEDAQRMEDQRAVTQAALVTISDYASGVELNDNQKQFMVYMKAELLTDADYKDTAYTQVEEALMNLTYEDLAARDKTYRQYTDVTVSMEFKRTALEALDMDVRIAKAAGLTLSQMYEMFPELRKDPYEMMDYAKKTVEQKWAVDDPKSVFGWLFGMNEEDFTGEGVGTGTALLKGSESGARQFAQGFMGFWRNYITETENKDAVVAQNRNLFKYGGAMGRVKAGEDFDKAIAAITDPARQEYWLSYKANVKDVLNLPFDFVDEAVLNTLYENKKAMDLLRSYMIEKGRAEEYAIFAGAESAVDNGLSMGTALATTAVTGNPTIGTAIAFGPRAAYDASEVGRAAGLNQSARNWIGVGAAGITIATEKWAFTGLQNSAVTMRGLGNLMKTTAMKEGAGFFKKAGAKIALGTATIGVKLAQNVAEQGTQEFAESVLSDVWLNISGAQNKDGTAMFEDGAREAVMAAILSPFLTGQAYLLTPKGKVPITKNMQAAAQQFMDARISEATNNPATLAKIINVNAAADTVDTLVNGGLAEVDTSVVEQTRDALKRAGPLVAKANDDFNAAREQYADEMQKYVERGEVISDAEHAILLQNIVTASKLYLSAKKTLTFLSDRLVKAQDGLDRLIEGIVKSVRDKEKVKAQADILCEIAARRMEANMPKADVITEATVWAVQPSPYNVSNAGNEGIPLAPNDGSGIMEEGTQGETGSGVEGEEEPDGQTMVGAYDNFRLTPELKNHIMYTDMSVPRNRGIGGAHNSDEFFKNVVNIVESIPSKDIPGVTCYKYNMPLLGNDEKPIGGYGKSSFYKTVYDPKVFPHSEYMQRGLEAANDARMRNGSIGKWWEGYDSLGVKWVGYGKDSIPTSFFPDIPIP